MSTRRLALGKSGEECAASFLRRRGYDIVESNWRCRLGEVDLIARKDDIIVICEVKTRSSRDFGDPVEAVTAEKQARLRRLGEYYRHFIGESSAALRFDVISVLGTEKGFQVEHLENAF